MRDNAAFDANASKSQFMQGRRAVLTMAVVSIVVFTIVLVVFLEVLQFSTFSVWSRRVIAVCCALLSMIGVMRSDRIVPEVLAAVLLPYAAVGLAVIVLLLLCGLSCARQDGRQKTHKHRYSSKHARRAINRKKISAGESRWDK